MNVKMHISRRSQVRIFRQEPEDMSPAQAIRLKKTSQAARGLGGKIRALCSCITLTAFRNQPLPLLAQGLYHRLRLVSNHLPEPLQQQNPRYLQ